MGIGNTSRKTIIVQALDIIRALTNGPVSIREISIEVNCPTKTVRRYVNDLLEIMTIHKTKGRDSRGRIIAPRYWITK